MTVDIHSKDPKVIELIKGKKPLIKQGQGEDRLFRITSGEAIVARETDSVVVPVARLEEGDFFGHLPFLDMGNEPQAASVFASPNLKLAALDPEALQKEHEKLSSNLQNILAHLAATISVTTMIACDYYKKALAG